MKEKIYLTVDGLEKIKKELNHLKNTCRPNIINSLKTAYEYGDLRENAEFDYAKEEQSIIESRIQELESIVKNVEIIEYIKTDKVSLGSTVKLEYLESNDIETYSIVGSKEADPFKNKISNESPLIKAILGFKKDSIVEVDSPNGNYKVKIVEIL